CSSRVRTPARSPSGTRDGSLIDPRSPREAQSSTTFTPPSASRAIVPPQVSDSSSGWANTIRTVGASTASGTMRLDHAFVDREVAVHHSGDAESRHRLRVDPPPIQIEHPRQLVDHLFEIVEDEAGHAVVDDFTHGA